MIHQETPSKLERKFLVDYYECERRFLVQKHKFERGQKMCSDTENLYRNPFYGKQSIPRTTKTKQVQT